MNPELNALRSAARKASEHAYVPYSQFPVGAVAGTVGQPVRFYGCNVENSSFSLTVCAERNVLAQSVSAGVKPGEIGQLAIYMPGDRLYSPCGACRQFISELMPADAKVYAFCDNDSFHCWQVSELLPDGFVLQP